MAKAAPPTPGLAICVCRVMRLPRDLCPYTQKGQEARQGWPATSRANASQVGGPVIAGSIGGRNRAGERSRGRDNLFQHDDIVVDGGNARARSRGRTGGDRKTTRGRG